MKLRDHMKPREPGTVQDLIAGRVPGRSLPGPLYVSPEAFDLDLDAIFARHWIFVASEPEIPAPGDYVTVDLGRRSVIIVRGHDGNTQAFHNVCRHRGARLLTERSGSVRGSIVCGYHRWTYGTDGTLRHAESQPASFDKNCWGLKPVPLRSLDGLLFICLSPEPPGDFSELASTVAPYLAVHDLRRTKVAAQLDLVEEGNWKLVMENNRECYHCDGHPELTCSLFQFFGYAAEDVTPRLRPAHQRYLAALAGLRQAGEKHGIPVDTVEESATRTTAFRIGRIPLDHAGESFSRDGGLLCRKLLGTVPSSRLGHLSLHMQPNSWFHFLSDHAVTFAVLPVAPDRTLLRTTWLVHADAVEGEDYDTGALTTVWRATNEQDAVLVARAHRGVSDPAYEPGPYAPNESQVEAFVAWYTGRLRARA
jgi:Rieske 2Fe-2S family protein